MCSSVCVARACRVTLGAQELIRNDMEMAGKVDPEVRAVLDY